MSKDKKVEEIRIFGGSLRELNSRDPSRQYVIVGDLFISRNCGFGVLEELTKKTIAENGYDGVIRAIRFEHKYGVGGHYQGVPIKLNSEK